MSKYGYIIDTSSFNTTGEDITWEFQRKEDDGTEKTYHGFETNRQIDDPSIIFVDSQEDIDVSTGHNVVIFNNIKSFKSWKNKNGKITKDIIGSPTMKCLRCDVTYEISEIKDSRNYCEFCAAAEDQSLERKARQSRIDFLLTQSAGTPIEPHVMSLLQRFAVQVVEFVETGSISLKDAINAEAEEPYLTYLAIEIPHKGGTITVKDNILLRITI